MGLCDNAGILHASVTNATAVLLTNLARENPMNSIHVFDDFTVTLVPDQIIDVRLIGIDRDDHLSGFVARIILPGAVNSKLSFF